MENVVTQKFHQLRVEKVLPTFHIKKVKTCKQLDYWLTSNDELTHTEIAIIDLALDRFLRHGMGWNEEELKMHFISPILNVANLNIEELCKTFFERPLSGIIDNYQLNIITDCMIASYNEGGLPVKPYFFLQEFKQAQLWGKTDPQGQMLVAMLLAQQQNANDKHLYGCFVKENNWHFATLKGLDYCVSRQFDSTQKDQLLQIVFILRKLKELILA
jgi:hypothetical protein